MANVHQCVFSQIIPSIYMLYEYTDVAPRHALTCADYNQYLCIQNQTKNILWVL